MERVEENSAGVEQDLTLDRLKDDLRREHEMVLRAMADFDNYRRRVERDRSKVAENAKRDVLRPLLEVVDGFERALAFLSEAPPAVAEGIQAIYRRLMDLIDAQGVKPIKTVGEPFHPAVHDAIGAVETNDFPPGTVVEEVQRGYRLGDEVLRPARVRVAQ
jgi:molecular chaperone GrpE